MHETDERGAVPVRARRKLPCTSILSPALCSYLRHFIQLPREGSVQNCCSCGFFGTECYLLTLKLCPRNMLNFTEVPKQAPRVHPEGWDELVHQTVTQRPRSVFWVIRPSPTLSGCSEATSSQRRVDGSGTIIFIAAFRFLLSDATLNLAEQHGVQNQCGTAKV